MAKSKKNAALSNKQKAKFKNGVLELTLPKVAHARRRTVTVE